MQESPIATDERTYSAVDDDGARKIWVVKRLWPLSENLPQFDYPIENFSAFNEDIWFCGRREPTVGNVLEHACRIDSASLDFPIILSEGGEVMDGVHRICKAKLLGLTSVRAVQFVRDPTPDSTEPAVEPAIPQHDD